MAIAEAIGLLLVAVVSIMLFLFQGNLWNPWNGGKEKELFNKHHDWSVVDKEMKPKRTKKRFTLITLGAVWLIGVILEVVGNLK